MIQNLSPVEVQSLLNSNQTYRIIDVREEWEYNLVKLDKAELMPLSKFAKIYEQLNPEEILIIYCHHGTRSYSICNFLKSKGYKNLINLKGGINAWSLQIDSSLTRY